VWMAPADRYWFAARRAGYERAMTEGGIAPLPTLLVPPRTIDMESHGRLWAGYLFELFQGPNAMDAVLLESDGNASEMAAVCRLFGKVPNVDVTIAGYDNYGSEMHDVPLVERPVVTVDKLNFCLGAEVVRLLLERAQGLLPEEPQLRKIAPRLVVNHPGRIESAAS